MKRNHLFLTMWLPRQKRDNPKQMTLPIGLPILPPEQARQRLAHCMEILRK